MADLTPHELARGEAMLGKATHVPWKKVGKHHIDGPRREGVACSYDWDEGGIVREQDAEAIVWLRNNATALIAAARELAEIDAKLAQFNVPTTGNRVRDLFEMMRVANEQFDDMRRQRDELRAEVERLRSCVTSAEQAAQAAEKAEAQPAPKLCDWCGEEIEDSEARVNWTWQDEACVAHVECHRAASQLKPRDEWGFGEFARGCLCQNGACECQPAAEAQPAPSGEEGDA